MNTSQTLRPEERRTASDPSMTGSKALIESFLQEGVETVFGYPGGAIIPVYDALYDYRDRLRHILVRHEQGAVHAAQGYARVSGRVGVCLVTSGPGATNTVTGLADALMDSTPLVLVTGQVGSSLLGVRAAPAPWSWTSPRTPSAERPRSATRKWLRSAAMSPHRYPPKSASPKRQG